MKNLLQRKSLTSLAMGVAMTLASFSAAAVDYHDQNFCAGKQLDTNYAHPEDCGRYISCDHSGRAQDMPCVSGLQFMQDGTRWGHCDYPEIAKCPAKK